MRRKKASELDLLLHKELDEFEKENSDEVPSTGCINQSQLTDSLKVIRTSVEEVFGPIFLQEPKTNLEVVRAPVLTILLSVIQQVCPKSDQYVYNFVEHHDLEDG